MKSGRHFIIQNFKDFTGKNWRKIEIIAQLLIYDQLLFNQWLNDRITTRCVDRP